MELDIQPFAVRPFFEDALAMFAGPAGAKKLALELAIDEAVPPFLLADNARLGQILTNLLGNAVKFTDQGVIGITVTFETAPDRLRVAVSDTGPGIAGDKLERLFQRFSQVDGSVSRRYGGTGLGLSICKGLAELMGGGIEVASTAGVGSTFDVWIAARPATAAPVNIGAAQPDPSPEAPASRILVVDDLDVNRLLVRTILEASGHRVDEAASGAEAITAAIGAPFDLILMDLQMPGMDGFRRGRGDPHASPRKTG